MRLALLLAALAALASGVYLPGVIPHDYLTNENVDLYVCVPLPLCWRRASMCGLSHGHPGTVLRVSSRRGEARPERL